MSESVKYIKALDAIKNFTDSQALRGLFCLWCKARPNYVEMDTDNVSIKEYIYKIY